MKNRNIVLLALAIGCGLVAAFVTAKLGASNKPDTVSVLVAAKNLDQGTKLDEVDKLFVRKPFTPETVPQDRIDNVNDLKGKTLQRTIRPGSHITQDDLTPRKTLDLPVRADGTMYKAIAIKVAAETVAGGLVLPGSRVDIISSERFQNGKTAVTTVLQNVLVVAVNAMTQTPDQQNAVKDAVTVTVAVTLKESKILYLATERGKISLVLRSKDDTAVVKNDKPIETLDNKRDDDSGGSDAGPATVKVPVPKKDIVPGTKIENPADLFDEKDLPEMALPATAVRSMEEFRGKTFTKHAYADTPVVKAALEGDLPKGTAVAVAAASKTHTMSIYVGTAAPQYYRYDEKGRLMEDAKSGAGPAVAAPPAGDSPAINLDSHDTKDGKDKKSTKDNEK
jgi:pilus assembly protein CpaB